MINKIERVSRVKGVDFDVGKKYDSNRESKNAFADTLRRVLNKKADSNRSEIPEAYKLDITSGGTQSLFYFGGLDLNRLLA